MATPSIFASLRSIIQQDPGNRGLARDPIENLFTVCPDDFENACRSIGDHPSPVVGIVTGFMIASVDPPQGETDGPLGALWLSLALGFLNIPNVIFTDHAAWSALEWTDMPLTDLSERNVHRVQTTGKTSVGKLTHLIALERCGPSYNLPDIPEAHRNRCHSMRGIDISPITQPAHILFEGDLPYTTIGIGDGGNEIGMGKVPRSVLLKNIPKAEIVACRVRTDHLIVAGVSNWGAYALGAGIALVKGTSLPPSFFDAETEKQTLGQLVKAGSLVDGVTGKPTATVDGLDFATYVGILQAIGSVVPSRL